MRMSEDQLRMLCGLIYIKAGQGELGLKILEGVTDKVALSSVGTLLIEDGMLGAGVLVLEIAGAEAKEAELLSCAKKCIDANAIATAVCALKHVRTEVAAQYLIDCGERALLRSEVELALDAFASAGHKARLIELGDHFLLEGRLLPYALQAYYGARDVGRLRALGKRFQEEGEGRSVEGAAIAIGLADDIESSGVLK